MRRLLIVGLMVACALLGTATLASAQTDPNVTPPTYGLNTPPCTDAASGCVEVKGISVTREELAFTGSSDTNLYAGIGVAVLLAGALLLVVSTRRRQTVRTR